MWCSVAQDHDKKSDEESGPQLPGPKAIGWGLVLLVLAGYFLWMIMEMGTAAVSGAAPMIAFLVSAAIGVAAAGIDLAVGRKRGA